MNRRYSLKKNRDFQYVYRRGKAYHCAGATMIVARGRGNDIALGISVSKKVGNAVVRNRVKRRMREILRLQLPNLVRCKKIVFVVRPCMKDWSYQRMQEETIRLLNKASLIVPMAAVK